MRLSQHVSLISMEELSVAGEGDGEGTGGLGYRWKERKLSFSFASLGHFRTRTTTFDRYSGLKSTNAMSSAPPRNLNSGGSSQVSLNNSAGIRTSPSKEKHFSHAEINEVTKLEQNQYVS